ncbi:hypothetical protein J1605_019512 [Eschrichtius robustus]|uniref:Uncharacterized protein n=1 Tax=Eschrichtius robustus TaxID=9764 RepID=A0AB34HIJ2_ESCRO|nr:hypothetical protein J1605_019512 [Eschrichtius robustus]
MWQETRGWGQQEEHRDQRGSRLASQAPEGEACNPLLCCSWVPTSRVSPQLARPAFTHRAAMGSVGSQQLQEPSVASTPHRSVVMSFSFDSGQLEEVVAGVAQARGSRARGIPISTDSGE